MPLTERTLVKALLVALAAVAALGAPASAQFDPCRDLVNCAVVCGLPDCLTDRVEQQCVWTDMFGLVCVP